MEMTLEPIITALCASGGGVGVAVLFAKYIVAKTLEDLEKVSEQVRKIREELAAITVRLSVISEHESILKDHAKRLAFSEGTSARVAYYGGRDS